MAVAERTPPVTTPTLTLAERRMLRELAIDLVRASDLNGPAVFHRIERVRGHLVDMATRLREPVRAAA